MRRLKITANKMANKANKDSLEELVTGLPWKKPSACYVHKFTLRHASENIWSASYESGMEVALEARADNPVDAVKKLQERLKTEILKN